MSRNRTVLSILLLAVIAFSLTGCHGAERKAAFTAPAHFDTTRNYTVVFWAKNDTNMNQTAIYEQAIADFQKLYPNITVTMRLAPDYARIYQDVLNNIQTNTTPNVCITYPDHIATYLTGENVMVPLDDLFTDPWYGLGGSELKFDSPTVEQIVPQFLQECAIGDHYYALPFMRSTEACYVNKTLVEKLGYELPDELTWDFIWEVSEAAMAKGEDGKYLINGQTTMIPFIYKSTDNMMIQMLRQKDAPYSTADGSIEIFNDDTREILKTVARHVQNGEFSTFKIDGYPGNFINAGQCIFAVDSTAGATWMGNSAPHMDISADQLVDFEMVVRHLPQYDWSNPKMISQGPSLCLFNKDDPQEVLASWLFMQFLLTNSVQIGYSETEGYVPVTLKAQQTEEYQDYLSRRGEDNGQHYYVKIDAAKLLIDNPAHSFVTPVFNGSATLRDTAGQLIEETAKGIMRKKTVDDAFLDDLFAKQSQLLHKLDKADDREKSLEEPLPGTAITLLCGLGAAWVLIIAVAIIRKSR